MSGYYVDISEWQPEQIDWNAYKAWSSQFDGISRVAIRSSYGTGFTDKHYAAYRSGAEKAGIDSIIFYHYAYPQFAVNTPVAEAAYQHSVVGSIRANDLIMLDFEENVPQANAAWCLEWLQTQEKNYGKKPLLYASLSYIQARLQDNRLARYPLVLAEWNTAIMPACPIPWAKYQALQLSDNASVPGIGTKVDLDLWV